MGTEFHIALFADDRKVAESAARAAFERIDELEGLLSDYDASSELRRLCALAPSTRPIPVSNDLWNVLAAANEVSAATDGAFDVTVGPYVRLWRRAMRQGEAPGPARLAEAALAVGYRKMHLEEASRSVRLDSADMRLDLGGIAKGYALDEALRILAAAGITSALVDGGGDIAASGPPPGRGGWRVAVASPFTGESRPADGLLLVHGALATSGDAFKRAEVDGQYSSHIIDPRTGLALTERRGASVLAPRGMLADALASALCVLGPEGLEALCERFAVDARALQQGGTRSRELRSAGFALRMLEWPARPPLQGAP